MPGLFHLLRKTVLGQNRMGRYLAYGLGEIVLLVIGILLALQINNWKEHYNDRVQEIAYLKKLKLDLEQNKKQVVEVDKYHDYMILGARRLLDAITDDTGTVSSDTLAVAMELAGWTRNSYFVRKAWDELMAIGNTNLIENAELLEELTQYYHRQTAMYYAEEKECNVFHEGIRRLTGEVLPPDIRFKIMGFLHPLGAPVPEQVELASPNFVHALREIDGVQGYLVDLIECRKTSDYILSLLQGKIDSLQQAVDRELALLDQS